MTNLFTVVVSLVFLCQARDEDLHGERSPQHPHTEESPRLVLKINSNIRVRGHYQCIFFQVWYKCAKKKYKIKKE